MTQEIYNDIKVDYSRDSLFDEIGKIRMKESYMKDDETSPQQRFAFVSKTFSSNKTYRMMGSGSVGRVVTSHKRSTVKIQPSITFTLVSSKLFLLKSGK